MLFRNLYVRLSVSLIEFLQFQVTGHMKKKKSSYIPGYWKNQMGKVAFDAIRGLKKPPEFQKRPICRAGLFVIEEGDRNLQYHQRYRCQYNHYSNNQHNNEVTFVAKHIISTLWTGRNHICSIFALAIPLCWSGSTCHLPDSQPGVRAKQPEWKLRVIGLYNYAGSGYVAWQ